MKFDDFLNYFQNKAIIDSSSFSFFGDAKIIRRQVRGWCKKGYLLSLKRGIYILNKKYRKTDPSVLFIANFLINPSYVSLEYALGYYFLIPEQASVITSVTTKKTATFDNPLGKFEYRNVKENLFFGMKKATYGGQEGFIATPEKAVADFFYLTPRAKPDFDYFDSMRFQKLETLNLKVLRSFKGRFNKRVDAILEKFIGYIKKTKSEYKKL
ncbi:MAG: hypothetical protein JW871_03355 [Endomicrobiales bacterium]|nr:hypothetical protein [Endomicrobiales bacterium]